MTKTARINGFAHLLCTRPPQSLAQLRAEVGQVDPRARPIRAPGPSTGSRQMRGQANPRAKPKHRGSKSAATTTPNVAPAPANVAPAPGAATGNHHISWHVAHNKPPARSSVRKIEVVRTPPTSLPRFSAAALSFAFSFPRFSAAIPFLTLDLASLPFSLPRFSAPRLCETNYSN